MARCDKCGFPLPNEADFCPNCGAAVIRKKIEVPTPSMGSIVNYLMAGLLGAFLSIALSLFSPSVDLYFIPSFVSSFLVIYLSRIRKLETATIIALAVYLFTHAIISGIALGSLFISNQPLSSLYEGYGVPTVIDVVMYTASPITAFIAAYLAIRLTPKVKEEPSSIPYRREGKEGPGGVVYSLKRNPEDMHASSPHKV